MMHRLKNAINGGYLYAVAGNNCVSACIKAPDVEKMRECLWLAWQCAARCRLLAQYMANGNETAPPL